MPIARQMFTRVMASAVTMACLATPFAFTRTAWAGQTSTSSQNPVGATATSTSSQNPVGATATENLVQGGTLDIMVNAAGSQEGGWNTLEGRQLTAYKLADYVDGTFHNTGDKQADGVAVDTPDALRTHLDRVLAKTTSVKDGKVENLPGWEDAGRDPIAWMGGFRQTTGKNDQAAGTWGYGWNESGYQKDGVNSPGKALVGSVREFSDNLLIDSAALNAVKTQPHSQTVTCTNAATCKVTVPSTGVYLIIDSGAGLDKTYQSPKKGADGKACVTKKNILTSQSMIVPTQADAKDKAAGTTDGTRLGSVGKLGVITIKNQAGEDVEPCGQAKRLDTSKNEGLDASDHASDIGDTIPYIVHYDVPDLSKYKNAYDNKDKWVYTYRVIDTTSKGLRINDGTLSITIPGTYGDTVTITPTKLSTLPAHLTDVSKSTGDGQPNEPDAWYAVEHDYLGNKDATHLVIGLGRWLVKNYGEVRGTDNTHTLYQHEMTIKYTATVTPAALDNGNRVWNDNYVKYSDLTNSGTTFDTPHTKIKQWLYDIDLKKKSSTSLAGLQGAKFTVTYKHWSNTSWQQTDMKPEGTPLPWVEIGAGTGVYRPATAADKTGVTTTVMSGKDGTLSLHGVDRGEYTLTETEAYPNYRLLKQSETVSVNATFIDQSAFDETTKDGHVVATDTYPDHQTAAVLTISQNNTVLGQKMFTFSKGVKKPGLTFLAWSENNKNFNPVTDSSKAQKAIWGAATDTQGNVYGDSKSLPLKNADGTYVADDKTNWRDTQLTLRNQPNNVMLAQTGAQIMFGVTGILGIILVGTGIILLVRRRRMMETRA